MSHRQLLKLRKNQWYTLRKILFTRGKTLSWGSHGDYDEKVDVVQLGLISREASILEKVH